MIREIIAPLVLALGLGSGAALATEVPATTATQPAEAFNPMAFTQFMNPAAYTTPGASTAGYSAPSANFNWFDPNAWTGMMAPQAQAQPEQPAQQQ